MEHNRTLSIIKDRKAKRFFILGGFIVVSAALGFMFLSSQQSRATIPSGGKQIEVGQVSYRLYESSNGINPGSPLANTNTAAALPKVGADFRLRVGLQNKSAYFKKLAEYGSGYEHNCAIMSDDSVYCWGNGQYGVLGTNSTTSSTTPVPVYTQDVLNGKTIKQVTTGFYHTCVIASDDKDYCWGYGLAGRLGNNGIVQRNAPYPVIETATTVVSQIAAGNEHTCSLNSERKLYCWGRGINGELGRDVFLGSTTPTAVNMGNFGTESVKQVVAGDKFTCAATVEGKAFCWGSNDKGRTGVGLATVRTQYPTEVKGFNGKKVESISAGDSHACSVISGGQEVYCWGNNNKGQVGNGQSSNSPVTRPTLIAPPGGAVESSSMKLRVEYAKKGSAATCSAVNSSDWQVVTGASKLAYSVSGPADGTNINSNLSDPELPTGTIASRPQSLVRKSGVAGTFTNVQKISAGEVGVWDVVLVDKGLDRNENYCVRVATDTTAAPGSSIDSYTMYPEFKTAPGSLDIRFRDNAGATITDTGTKFDNSTMSNSSVATSALLSNSSSKQIEVTNTQTISGWSVVLSASDGATAKWKRTGGTESYMFNGTNGDQGFLSVNFGTSSVLASGNSLSGSTCQISGISKGVDSQFKVGTATANGVTLMSSSGSTGQLGCAFLLQNVRLNQTIPAYQKPGTYELPMTLTVTAQ